MANQKPPLAPTLGGKGERDESVLTQGYFRHPQEKEARVRTDAQRAKCGQPPTAEGKPSRQAENAEDRAQESMDLLKKKREWRVGVKNYQQKTDECLLEPKCNTIKSEVSHCKTYVNEYTKRSTSKHSPLSQNFLLVESSQKKNRVIYFTIQCSHLHVQVTACNGITYIKPV